MMERVSFSTVNLLSVMFGFLTGFAVIRRSVLTLERGRSFVRSCSIMHKWTGGFARSRMVERFLSTEKRGGWRQGAGGQGV